MARRPFSNPAAGAGDRALKRASVGPRVYYAIGDVHGLAARLRALHDMILADWALVHDGARAVIVHLGDYIDRGPDSRGVITAIMALEREARRRGDFDVVALRGNHEQMMIDAIGRADGAARRLWTMNGGDVTLESYRRAHARRRTLVDPSHLRWVRRRPMIHAAPEDGLVFVHAGIDPGAYPACADGVRLWTRAAAFLDTAGWPPRPELEGVTVVHGHTPTADFCPDVEPSDRPQRINVDTGAVFGGPLTCVALAPDRPPRFLQA